MIGHELAVEQPIAAHLEPRDEPGEGDLGGVAAEGKHALPEKGGAKRDSVEPADQLAILPALDAMGMAFPEQQIVAFLDIGVDPGLFAIGATTNRLGKGAVGGDIERAGPNRLPQRAGQAEAI